MRNFLEIVSVTLLLVAVTAEAGVIRDLTDRFFLGMSNIIMYSSSLGSLEYI